VNLAIPKRKKYRIAPTCLGIFVLKLRLQGHHHHCLADQVTLTLR